MKPHPLIAFGFGRPGVVLSWLFWLAGAFHAHSAEDPAPEVTSYRDYAFFAFLPGSETPVFTGLQKMEWLQGDRVRANTILDVPSRVDGPLMWAWNFQGDNRAQGQVEGTLTDGGESSEHRDFGRMSLRKTIRGQQIWWEGEVTINDARVLESRFQPKWAQASGLSPLPPKLSVKLVGFLQSPHEMTNEVGSYAGEVLVGWPSETDRAARTWLKKQGFTIQNEAGRPEDNEVNRSVMRSKDDRRLYTVHVPAFDENLIVWKMLGTDLFSEVHRLGFESALGEGYFLAYSQGSIFPEGLQASNAPSQAKAFVQDMLAHWKQKPEYSQVVVSDLVSLGNYRMQFSIMGRSHLLREKGTPDHWDRNVVQVQFLREFGQPPGELTLRIESIEETTVKWPEDTPPDVEKFDDTVLQGSSGEEGLIPRLGSKLGDISQALYRKYHSG